MTRIWAVVPAAGVGRRMGAEIPKQYLPLAGRTVIEITLSVLVEHPRIDGVCVALGTDDERWRATDFASDSRVTTVPGGAERVHSVRNALASLAVYACDDDWVLVHDAARPCVRPGDIERLITTLIVHPVGGLLGMKVRDTMKRTNDEGAVLTTVDRSHLWHAFTPQMFRLAMLRRAIDSALANGIPVTDEASAVEHLGLVPRMVEGHADNLKVTHPMDLPLAELFLSRRDI